MRAPLGALSILVVMISSAPAIAAPAAASGPAPAIAPVRTDPPTAALEPARGQAIVTSTGALQSALEAEAGWRDPSATPAARALHLVTAARARALLGHRAHAAAYLRAYLADGRADPEAARELAALEAALVPVEVVVHADPKDTPITIEVDFYGRPSDVLPPLITQLVRDGDGDGDQRITVFLTAGKWNIAIPEDGYYSYQEEDITVAAEGPPPPPVEMTLATEIPPGSRPMYIGVRAATSPLVLGGVGIGILAGGQVAYGRTLARTDTECAASLAECRELLSRAITLRSTGTGLLGAAFGVGTAVLSGMAKTRRARAIVWGVESLAGAASLIGGAVGVSLAARDFNAIASPGWESADYRDPATGAAARHSGSSFALGYGAGLVVYSLYYLARDQVNAHVGVRKRRRDRQRVFALTPSGGPTGLGAGVGGRF